MIFESLPFFYLGGIMIVNYFGVYGVCLRDDVVLCIKKARGPYKNRYDLPGGSQKEYEGLTETLIREYLEETGYNIKTYDNCRIYDVFVEEINRTVHHIMVFYDVEIEQQGQKNISSFVDSERNDSNGACWVSISELNINNASPLLLKLKQEVMNDSCLLEKTVYKSWEIL